MNHIKSRHLFCDLGPARESIVHEIIKKYYKKEPLDSKVIERLSNSLSQKEHQVFGQLIKAADIEAEIQNRNFLSALAKLEKALTVSPNDLNLNWMYSNLLKSLSVTLSNQIALDPANPIIRETFNILLQANVDFDEIAEEYLNFLILNQNYQEARNIIISFYKLYPVFGWVREMAEKIYEKSPHADLEPLIFNETDQLLEVVDFIPASFTPGNLMNQLSLCSAALHDSQLHEDLEKRLAQILDDESNEKKFNLQLVEFYLIRAKLLELKGQLVEAFFLYDWMIESIPMRADFRINMFGISRQLSEKLLSAYPFDEPITAEIYALLAKMHRRTILPRRLLEKMILFQVQNNQILEAKTFFKALMTLNPKDIGNLRLALKVANELKEFEVVSQIENQLKEIYNQRPWFKVLFEYRYI